MNGILGCDTAQATISTNVSEANQPKFSCSCKFDRIRHVSHHFNRLIFSAKIQHSRFTGSIVTFHTNGMASSVLIQFDLLHNTDQALILDRNKQNDTFEK